MFGDTGCWFALHPTFRRAHFCSTAQHWCYLLLLDGPDNWPANWCGGREGRIPLVRDGLKTPIDTSLLLLACLSCNHLRPTSTHSASTMRSAILVSSLLLPGFLASHQAASSTALSRRSFPGLQELVQGFSDLANFEQGLHFLPEVWGWVNNKAKLSKWGGRGTILVFQAALLKSP